MVHFLISYRHRNTSHDHANSHEVSKRSNIEQQNNNIITFFFISWLSRHLTGGKVAVTPNQQHGQRFYLDLQPL